MAFTSGTIAGGTAANGHLDLLSEIRTFCTTGLGSANWTEIKWALNGSEREWMFIAPGLSGTEQIFGGIRTVTGAGYANLQLAGYFGNYGVDPGWDTGFDSQPFTQLHYVTCSSDPIDYWLVANGQRLCCVFRVGSIWSMFYLGKFLPYASPSEYPYPFLVAGTNDSSTAQTSDVANHRHFVNGAINTTSVYLPSNIGWFQAYNMSATDTASAGSIYISPTVSARMGSAAFATVGATRANPDGSLNLVPVQFVSSVSPGGTIGEPDGVYWTSGLDQNGSPLVAGAIVDVGGTDHIVFPNINRTTWAEWAAMRLS